MILDSLGARIANDQSHKVNHHDEDVAHVDDEVV
jgi:hypothetical protein